MLSPDHAHWEANRIHAKVLWSVQWHVVQIVRSNSKKRNVPCKMPDLHKKTRGNLQSSKHMSIAHPLLLPPQTILLTVLVVSRFSCPARTQVRTLNSRILACVRRARDDDTSVQIEFFGFEDGCVSSRSWFETRSRLECWRRSCAKAYIRNIARRHNVRSFSASFSRYRL